MEGHINTFRDIVAWQKAHQLVLYVYTLTKAFPKDESFALTSQARRSAASVSANIVEGFRRKSLRDSLNFYRIADTSLEELKYHILLSRDLQYIDESTYQKFVSDSDGVGRLLARWMQSQQHLLTA